LKDLSGWPKTLEDHFQDVLRGSLPAAAKVLPDASRDTDLAFGIIWRPGPPLQAGEWRVVLVLTKELLEDYEQSNADKHAIDEVVREYVELRIGQLRQPFERWVVPWLVALERTPAARVRRSTPRSARKRKHRHSASPRSP
jgi:hypothetical protein